MALTQPGTYVLYRERGGEQAAWPGITVPDDVAPQHIRRGRPSGYMTLTLLFGATYQFRWATISQLSPFVPVADNTQHALPDKIRQAFMTADFGLEAGLDVEYWRDLVTDQINHEKMLDAGVKFDSERIDLESLEDDQDEELRAALRISHEQFFGKKSALFPTPSCSPPAQYKRKRNRPERIILPDEDTDDDHNSLYSYPYPTPPKKKPATAHQYGSPPHSGNSFGQSGSATSNKNSRYLPEGPINFDQLLRQGQNSAAPTSDEIEGDISESKESVRIAVGPDREIRTLLKNHVWNRPYFREPRSGLNHFTLKDDNIWELNHPELAKLDLADFQFLAEYLAEGEFGLRYPEGPEQTKEVIAQCVSTWEMGDKLGMYDLLEHIVEKVQYFEWDNTDVLIFAVIVYRTPDQPTPAHESMRDWLSGYLAQHFWTYIRDDTIGPLFRQRLKAIPDLERQVFEKRTAMLVSGAELDEDGESDGDGL